MKIGDVVIYSPATTVNLKQSWINRIGKEAKIISYNPFLAKVLFEGEKKTTLVGCKRLKLKNKSGHHLTNIFK